LVLLKLLNARMIDAPMPAHFTWLSVISLGAILVAAAILVVFLWKKPALDLPVKMWLFLGLGVFPFLGASTSTVAGMERTTERSFCGSCHVMDEHFADSSDPNSQSLAARHSRNPMFGGHSCYVCHADYGMYGYALTKAGGMGHVYEYYLGGYKQMSMAEAKAKIHIKKPYDNNNCRQCHTTTLADWREVPEHISLKAELLSNRVSCASAGCHGFAHPFFKSQEQRDSSTRALPVTQEPSAVQRKEQP
jgi:nitrate/TMAO reductase-like tetraheme cytochrome c subunit